MYSKILRELNKGNAVLLEVRFKHAVKNSVNRYRIVTPSSCEFTYVGIDPNSIYNNFFNSCFMERPIISTAPTAALVKRMFMFDKTNNLHINKMQVLK